MCAFGYLLLDDAHDFRVRVSKHHRAVAGPVVYDSVAVNIPLDAAPSMRRIQGKWGHGSRAGPFVASSAVADDVARGCRARCALLAGALF